MFLLPILTPACNSSSPAFLMMCSVCGLNNDGDSRQPCCTPFLILSQSVVPYTALTVASWPTYRFLRTQVRWSGIDFSLRAFHSLSWSTHDPCVKGFGVVEEIDIDVFLEFPIFLYDPVNVGNLVTVSFSFSKPSLDIWKFLIQKMLKANMQYFKHDLTSMGDEWNCPVVNTFFGTTLLGNWNEDWPFPVLWPLLGLPDLLTYWIQHLDGIIL